MDPKLIQAAACYLASKFGMLYDHALDQAQRYLPNVERDPVFPEMSFEEVMDRLVEWVKPSCVE
jgi:hypothetical protein